MVLASKYRALSNANSIATSTNNCYSQILKPIVHYLIETQFD